MSNRERFFASIRYPDEVADVRAVGKRIYARHVRTGETVVAVFETAEWKDELCQRLEDGRISPTVFHWRLYTGKGVK